jgi:DNA-binding NtrC family response regulator
LPPLRERIEDIPQLSLGFLREILGEKAPTSLEPAVELCLQTISYPGNVRELKNVVRLAAARFAGGSELRLAHLPREVLQAFVQSPRWDRESLTAAAEAALIQGADFTDFVDAAKDAMVQAALRLAKGSSKEAATRIGVSERCVQLRRRGGAREDAGELTDRLSAAP